jgi:hypothetical protein
MPARLRQLSTDIVSGTGNCALMAPPQANAVARRQSTTALYMAKFVVRQVRRGQLTAAGAARNSAATH